ncbi:glycosyltransferase [Haloterrigena salifodinae]|uniref:glycosyltransferase n=1 Tax=Haloterrigena salifodinae TaxID=2675099 RepID=UPI001E632B7E|nr:glycosyltransferase [Haloterrigena salifodinae]
MIPLDHELLCGEPDGWLGLGLTQLRYESGPMTIKEAAACNVPVVSRDVGFAREVLEPVSDSHVVADDDALQPRLADVLAGDRRSDGRAHVTGYTVDEMGARLRAVYQRCLENEA